ncbi:hypothetical protein [Pseudomonas sp. SLFW]|nr:hypothetical protein [Pseudomonas sp. SLFW]
MIGCLVFFTWSLKQGPRHVIEKVFDVTIVDIVSSGPTVAVDDLQL